MDEDCDCGVEMLGIVLVALYGVVLGAAIASLICWLA
jgi:hypothetical protein